LGLNDILGYICSFSKGNYPSRICRVHKNKLQIQHIENATLLRNAENCALDFALEDAAKTGIKQACVLSKIPSFNVWDNVAFDVMHDIFEGVAHYDLIQIFNKFIFEDKLFSLEELNERIHCFDYGNMISDAPTAHITANHLDNKKLSVSASEMICFVALMIAEWEWERGNSSYIFQKSNSGHYDKI
jgi:hypothetical protein